jgi:hypothetical protein
VWGPGITDTAAPPTYLLAPGSSIALDLNAAGSWYVGFCQNYYLGPEMRETIANITT